MPPTYRQCPYCKQTVRINKPLLKAWHFCLSDGEKEIIDAERDGRPPDPWTVGGF